MTKNILNLRNVAMIACLAGMTMCSVTLNAQSLGEKLKNAAKNAAENAAVRKTEQKVDNAVSKSIDKATDPNSYKGEKKDDDKGKNNKSSSNANNENPPAKQTGKSSEPQNVKSLEMVYAKSDFVPGDEIFFEDNQINEKMGEFPSQWDLVSGSVEIANLANIKCILIEDGKGHIRPLMNDMENYLPDVFTLEFDFWVNDKEETFTQSYALRFLNEKREWWENMLEVRFGRLDYHNENKIEWSYKVPSETDRRRGDAIYRSVNVNNWNHFSLSFNKRALKIYINGIRVANIPNMVAPNNFEIFAETWCCPNFKPALANFRLAKGAVPLYDRMMSDGRIITYGITFDIGKSTIKPESMGEINRIVTLMKENPELKFSVEGHTDNIGNANSNQTLSEARSQAVVDKLVENGISKDRLKAAGKGQTSPIADNGTDEGRAKNRRVEFVKL